jgi:hypothetical protein
MPSHRRHSFVPRRRRHYHGHGHGHGYGYDSYSESDDDDEYEVVIEQYTEISNIKSTNYRSTLLKPYRYKHDESRETVESCEYAYDRFLSIFKFQSTYPTQYPFYLPMPVIEIPSIERPLFFNQYCSYFLNKNGLAINRDGTYLVKMLCPDHMEMNVEVATLDRIFPEETEETDESDELELTDLSLREHEQREALYNKKQRAHKLGHKKRQKSVDRESEEHSERSRGLYGKRSSKSPKFDRSAK